ncbi:murein transglycosylase A [Testudinibacter aquarius]|uniref:Membrane-bound lytic murein transglycosylase A n=3 Tax=Testudinibacter aquarius TaxID=1524974 RepID=A0A4R3Y7L7_9PAST|nr:murein transglycosylase A [Testudinibacter aquarius]KAE9528917.1 murein transglycosylase A [Testudinibacter aquarius]TCV87830.1 membrane-bound lytic murein transglycosylase A [Testudinibacter aquarius]
MIKSKIQFGLIASAILFLSACGSTPSNIQQDERSLHQKMGAVYQGRSYISPAQNLVPVSAVANSGSVVNQGDFLTQLSIIENTSPRMANNYASTYNKVVGWVLAGANVEQLNQYGVNLQQMRGEDGYQNVLMTGYFSPVIHARRTPQGKYQHPIHALPTDKRYSRAQIYAGALNGKGMELAYSDSMLDNFLLGVQGSGYVDFGNGTLNYFAYAGQNGFKYQAIGRLLVEQGEIEKEKMSIQAIRDWANRNPSRLQGLLEQNPSYVFFKNDPNGKVRGSAGIPLVPLASLASDRSVIPSGSVLLVEEPLIDNKGNWTGQHQLRLMVALDVGGAVKGQHFDLYQGIGDDAGHRAGLMKHYGRVWLLK